MNTDIGFKNALLLSQKLPEFDDFIIQFLKQAFSYWHKVESEDIIPSSSNVS